MADLRFIAIHHSGALGSDPYASSARISVLHINNAHKARWNFPSIYMRQPNGSPHYAGYNVIYDPKTREFVQTRALGEETAAQTGHNFDTFSLCIIGNFTKRGSGSVDELTDIVREDVIRFLYDLLNGNRRNLITASKATLSFDITRVHPHRFYQQTQCYGTAIDDNHFRDLLMAFKPVVVPPTDSIETPAPIVFKERARIERQLLKLYAKIADLLAQVAALQKKRDQLGAEVDRSCEGYIMS